MAFVGDDTLDNEELSSFSLSQKGQKSFDITMCIYPAVILHPSLGCPLVVDAQGPVSLFVVTDSTFRKAFLSSNGGKTAQFAKGGPDIANSISQHLKVVTWDKAKEVKKNIQKNDKTIAQGTVSKENVTCTYLGELEAEIKRADGKHFANVRKSVLEQFQFYREDGTEPGLFAKYFSNDGLRHLFQIDLHNMALSPGALYDCFWVMRNVNPHKSDYDSKCLDIQDRIARDTIRTNYYKYAQKEGPLCAFKVTGEGVELTPDPDTPIQTRHPIYVAPSGKGKLNIGHLSDIHVSSKQNAYKGKQATVIPGADTTTSPPIGEMANNNGDNFFDLLQQMGKSVDAVVITGDLYDHLHNFDPAKLKDTTTGKLWEAMYLAEKTDVHNRNEEYPCGIDELTVYSLLIHFYDTHKKPLFITCGNHEAYEYPYGISPRIDPAGVEIMKPNDGIPLDHNLTFYEAILLYGPGYSKVLKSFNFDSKNFHWFYTVFTPLADFWQVVGDQCLIGLGWGDGESFVRSKARGGGTLPRATDSLDGSQISLVATALQQGKDATLCSHFTMVNYSLAKPLTEAGKITVGKIAYTDYDHGSSSGDRETLYGRFLNHPNLKLSLAGHSHRAGLYRFEPVYALYDRGGYTIKTLEGGTTRGVYPEDANAAHFGNNGQTKLLVSASTGPIPKQNFEGEMSGQGMEYPSGSKVDASGKITLVKSRKQTAKPRFCVACDYIDIMEGGFWEYFRCTSDGSCFEMKPHWEKIDPKLSQAATKPAFIKSADVWVFEKGKGDPYRGKVALAGDRFTLKAPKELPKKLRSRARFIDAIFLSVVFDSSVFGDTPGFKDYDFGSPWNIQVEVYNKAYEDGMKAVALSASLNPGLGGGFVVANQMESLNKRKDENRPEDFAIRRHEIYGEVPDHKERAKSYPREYAYNLNRSS